VALDSDPDFTLDVRHDGGVIVVAPKGELDISTVPQVEQALRQDERTVEAVTLDLSGLSFMDTSGLRLVLEEDRRARTGGHTLRLVPGSPHVQRVFELAGILDRLPFVSTPAG
jgi:anti-sigma B factor antagonist